MYCLRMSEPKFKTWSDIPSSIKHSIKEKHNDIKQNQGYGLKTRVLIVRFLWVYIMYNSISFLYGFTGLVESILTPLGIFIIAQIVLNILGTMIHPFLSNFLSGKFFDDFSVHLLNQSFFAMLLIILFLIPNLNQLKPIQSKHGK